MTIPLQVTFRGLDASPAVQENIQKRAQRLERFDPGVRACLVTIEQPHHSHQQGNHFRVQIELVVAGTNIVVTRGSHENPAHEDVYIVIRDAFNAAVRRMQDRVRRPRTAQYHPRAGQA